ncbi:MAG: hypothetical protein ACRBEE_05900, partial [Arenicella sp.]
MYNPVLVFDSEGALLQRPSSLKDIYPDPEAVRENSTAMYGGGVQFLEMPHSALVALDNDLGEGLELRLVDGSPIIQDLPATQGRYLLAGDFIAELPITMQRKFDDLVMSGDREARVFDRYINTGAGLSTSDPTTIGAVMYLCGQAVPDGDGGT